MGQHGGVAGEGTQALSQHAGQLAVSTRQMFLSVEYSHEDVAEARKGETTCSCPLGRPVQAAQIKQVEPAASTCHAHGLARVGCGVVEAVLVHMEGVEEVGLPPVSVPGAAGEGGVQVKGCLLHSGGPHL